MGRKKKDKPAEEQGASFTRRAVPVGEARKMKKSRRPSRPCCP